LFKIELDPAIRPIVEMAVVASRIPEPQPWFEFETCKKTGKVEALADDTTVLQKCEREDTLYLQNTLAVLVICQG
jgi:hypothetical protein